MEALDLFGRNGARGRTTRWLRMQPDSGPLWLTGALGATRAGWPPPRFWTRCRKPGILNVRLGLPASPSAPRSRANNHRVVPCNDYRSVARGAATLAAASSVHHVVFCVTRPETTPHTQAVDASRHHLAWGKHATASARPQPAVNWEAHPGRTNPQQVADGSRANPARDLPDATTSRPQRAAVTYRSAVRLGNYVLVSQVVVRVMG